MSDSDVGRQPLPPYVPWKTFVTFLDSLRQGIPSRIDRTVMPTFSGAMQSQVMSALRYLGLIDEQGRPLDALSQLVTSESTQREEILRDILDRAYRFLADLNIGTATSGQLEEAFKRAGATGDTVRKCIAFFLAANQYAGVSLSRHLKAPRARQGVSRRRQQPRRRPAQQIGSITFESEEPRAQPAAPEYLTWEQMLLAKFPTFDPSWPDEVKAEWFKAFNRLMSRDGGDA